MDPVTIAVISTIVSTLLGGLASGIGKETTADVINTLLQRFLNREPGRIQQEDLLAVRLQEANHAEKAQSRAISAYSFASFMFAFSQFVIGGLLTSSFLQSALSAQITGILGLLVLASSLMRQYFHTDVELARARRKKVYLKRLIRRAQYEKDLIRNNIDGALKPHEIVWMLSEGLSQIEEEDLISESQTSSIAREERNPTTPSQ